MEHPANTLISEGFACLENVRLLNIIAKILLVAFRVVRGVQYLPDPQYSVPFLANWLRWHSLFHPHLG